MLGRRIATVPQPDEIGDFSVVDDTIGLRASTFSGLPPFGPLMSGAFHRGPAAHDASDRIIYNPTTGTLLYDSDGTGRTAAVQVAQLTPGLALTESDFWVL